MPRSRSIAIQSERARRRSSRAPRGDSSNTVRLTPIGHDGDDHVPGATNYRSLRADELRSTQAVFRRLPMAPRTPAIAKDSRAHLITVL
jgi:hypothetical protein